MDTYSRSETFDLFESEAQSEADTRMTFCQCQAESNKEAFDAFESAARSENKSTVDGLHIYSCQKLQSEAQSPIGSCQKWIGGF